MYCFIYSIYIHIIYSISVGGLMENVVIIKTISNTYSIYEI